MILRFADKLTQIRRFAVVSTFANRDITLPTRKTKGSAGYDICILDEGTIPPGQTRVFDTGLKAYMNSDEYLSIHIRSSVGIKRGLILSNSVGIIDSDYVDNSENEGHIMIALTNIGRDWQRIKSGDRIAQGIFCKYLVTSDDNAIDTRIGGFGSTGQ